MDHSERNVHNVVKVQGTRLKVPMKDMLAGGVQIPWIRPRDWLQFIINKGLACMFAGLGPDQKHLSMKDMLAGGVQIPWIRPRDWLQFIINKGLACMFAGLGPDQKHLSCEIWRTFWRQYRTLNPDFGLFSEPGNVDFGRTFAFLRAWR